MKNYLLLLLTSLLTIVNTEAQNIGINTNTPHASAALDITSTNSGVLIPRLTGQQRLSIALPANGLLVYDSSSNSFWYRDSAAWQELLPATKAWKLTGNSGTDTSIHFIGTSDAQPLVFKVNNTRSGIIDHYYDNTSFGYQSLPFDGSLANTAIGSHALFSNITGSHNTAIGGSTLYSNTTGEQNSATGLQALKSNTTGSYNTANGRAALYYNTTGKNNTAIGYSALQANITGYSNVAIGFSALISSTDRSNLVAIGDSALYNNGYGVTQNNEAISNTAVGSKALYSNKAGSYNTADGYQGLYSNTAGNGNTAVGHQALYNTSTGSNNTGLGNSASVVGGGLSYSTAIGAGANTGCSNCLVLGGYTPTTRTRVGINTYSPLTDLQIAQQSDAAGNTSRGFRLQRSSGAFWRMYVDGGSALTFELNDGGAGSWGWINTSGSFVDGSDVRSKKNIQPSETVLDKLVMLHPMKYQFNQQAESENFTYGFVAQEVQKVFPEFVHEREGGMLGITYSSFGVIAVKAIQEQQLQITSLKKDNDALHQQLQNMMVLINALNEKVGALVVK